MKKLILACLLAAAPMLTLASEGAALAKFQVDLGNRAGLQRGARTFVNYCVSCHSAEFMRYSRMAQDLGLTPEQVQANMIFNGGDVHQVMRVALGKKDGAKWFGQAPPDLTLAARSRGPDWLYAYLRSFYLDPSRPFGVNNTVFPNAAMPHVLANLQGAQELRDGHLQQVSAGTLKPAEYDAMIRDLVNFMVYIGEPAKLVRYGLGVKVMLFLLVFAGLAYMLKREYWRDVH
ncbi:cytochrome c1 [Immundisolibacter sp.]|uniref:cytochrome c1 n=1 Tax=Immundisolibacter sp. TaxID=1934948 RepID=UPI00262FDF3E|nr:cytochrome c1 [Immundisolibacter sp.]MDD3650076.1 cytochrome c1 [Immundisolibacter sp.]